MKKNYLIAILILVVNLVNAQIEPTSYRGAFAPAPTAMWTDTWTNWDPKTEPYTDAATVVNVTTDITANTTWTTGKTYKMTGLIYVKNNAILTIQPGVVVKGVYSSTGTALIVTKGAKLNAIGTATAPIVFTSAKVAGSRAAGDWGGIILLGKAGFNLNNGINNIEGIAATVNTEYGGGTTPNSADSSGSLKYVRIEFGGYVFSPNNEINGLTFGAVGSGTTIDNVQVSYSGDDSFEWFGGAVNCKHLVAYRGLDDDFDTDNGYKGVNQFLLGIRDPSIADNPAISVSEGFESDNNAAGSVGTNALTDDRTSAIFTNCTLIGPSFRATLSPSLSVASGHARAARLRRASEQKIFNSIFLDFKNSFLFVDGSAAVANANAGTLKFKNNIIAGTIDATYSGGVNPVSLNSWFSTNGNTIQASSASVLTAAYGAGSSVYSGLDYRPGTIAASGADFTDASMSAYIVAPVGDLPVASNVSYCKGTVASPLVATMSTSGVSLKWYTVATAGVAVTTAPTPVTTIVGDKFYYVSQVNASGVESARVKVTVTTNALPTEVLGVITGTGPVGSTSAVAVGKYVGTTAAFTYTVPAFADATLSYLWTVPNGATITDGQGTNTITVNYLNEPVGVGSVGSIQVQAVNATGCKTVAKILALTKALPAAPAVIKVTNAALALPVSGVAAAVTSYAKYMGTTTPLTITATAVDAASFYQWELPAGVNVVAGVTGTSTVRYFTAIPFTTPLTATPAPAVGTKYWKVTYSPAVIDVNGVATTVVTSTAIQYIQGGSTYGATTNQVYAPYGTVITSDKNAIVVNFSGVTTPTTTALYLGVKSGNGVGVSVTSNVANVDVVAGKTTIPGLFADTYTEVYTAPVPTTVNATSVYTLGTPAVKTSKLLKLTAALPLAPAAIKMTNDVVSTTTAVLNVSKFVGTTTPFTLTATASIAAASYTWELPSGVTQLSGGNSNVITVDFSGVAAGTTTLYIGVKSVNGIGSSVTVNAGLESTAKVLKLTAALPAAVATVTGQITALCGSGSYDYTMVASPLATSYVITAPVGSVVTSASNPENTSNVLATSDLTFSVKYNGLVSTTAAPKYITIASVNGVGASLLNKSLKLVTGTCSVARQDSSTKEVVTVTATEVYPNPTYGNFNVDVVASRAGVLEMTIYSFDGTVAVNTKSVQLQEGSNTISEEVSSLRSGIYLVQLVNAANNEVIVKKMIKK